MIHNDTRGERILSVGDPAGKRGTPAGALIWKRQVARLIRLGWTFESLERGDLPCGFGLVLAQHKPGKSAPGLCISLAEADGCNLKRFEGQRGWNGRRDDFGSHGLFFIPFHMDMRGPVQIQVVNTGETVFFKIRLAGLRIKPHVIRLKDRAHGVVILMGEGIILVSVALHAIHG